MELKKVMAELRLPETTELVQVLQVGWEATQKSIPSDTISFLSLGFVADGCRRIRLPEEITQAAIIASRRITPNLALRALAWHCHCCLFRCAAYPQANINRWPFLTKILQDAAGMFYFLVLLSGLPKMQAIYRARSILTDIMHDTLSQVKSATKRYHKKYGNWGLTVHDIGWFMNHFYGKLFQLGRLQFQFGFFQYRLWAFRHRASGTVMALSEGGIRYLADGQVDGAGRIYDTTGAWTSQLVLTNDEIIGYPILPTGCALQRKVRFSTGEWQQVLAPGDPVLNIHIPGGGPMNYNLCGKSFQSALKFFPRYFPEKPFVCFCCSSWLLDAQLEELLPPTSNLVRFQQEVYLFPLLSDDLHLLKVVFGGVPRDLTKASRDTVLQRALLDRLLAGHRLRAKAGGFFLLPDDFNWGAQVYRTQAFPWQAQKGE